jgi:hypothetical protein
MSARVSLPQPDPSTDSFGRILAQMANSKGSNGSSSSAGPQDPFGGDGRSHLESTDVTRDELPYDSRLRLRVKPIERMIAIDCRQDSLWLPADGAAVSLRSDRDVPTAVSMMGRYALRQANGWQNAPHGREWKPVLLLRVRSGGLANAYRLEMALVGTGVEIRHVWLGLDGSPLVAKGGSANGP